MRRILLAVLAAAFTVVSGLSNYTGCKGHRNENPLVDLPPQPLKQV